MTGNEKLCKIYFKKLFFQKASIDLFIDIIISPISSTQIARDIMCVQYAQKQPPEMLFKKRFSQKFCKFHRKKPVLESFFKKVAGLRACNFIKTDSNRDVFL